MCGSRPGVGKIQEEARTCCSARKLRKFSKKGAACPKAKLANWEELLVANAGTI